MDLNAIILVLLKLGSVMLLVLLNGFFVAAEFALVRIRETQLLPLVTKGHRRAKVAQSIVRNLDATLSATQLGITLASLGLGWFAEPVFASILQSLIHWLNIKSELLKEWEHTIAFIIGFSAITFLHIVTGELSPKWIAIKRPLPTSLWVATPLDWFRRLSNPFIWILNNSATWLLGHLGIQIGGTAEHTHSEDELRLLVSSSRKQSDSALLGRDIVLNALDLRHRIAREVMRPRKEITAFDTEASIGDCLEIAEKTRYSRFPICEHGDLDKTRGVVHLKDLFAMRHKANTGRDLIPVSRKLIYVPETSRLEKLLQLFLERKVHFAIVVDEYGGTVGMVTLENILEEIVGQIQDEFDQEKPLLVKKSEHVWEIDGALPLHDLATLVGEPLHEEGITTVSGWVTHRLGGFPRVNDATTIGQFELKVESTDGSLVARLKLTRKVEENTPPA